MNSTPSFAKVRTVESWTHVVRRFLAFSLIAVGLCASASADIYVSSLAGQLTSGSADGTGAAAQFKLPFGVAYDGTNLYVADQANNSIRKIVVATGVVTTYATGLSGPAGVAVDTAGNVYVADTNHNVILKYTAANTGSIIAGQSGVSGFADAPAGPATAATFHAPYGIAVDGAGANIYVADSTNHTIRKIVVATGVVSTLAGQAGVSGYVDSASGTPKFNSPYSLAVDGGGNVYVADTLNNVIRKVTAAGVVTTVAGSGTFGYLDGSGAGAYFKNPYGIAIDSTATNLYVADTLNHVIRQIVIGTGVVSTPAGFAGNTGSTNGLGSAARFNGPSGIAAGAAGTVFVAEISNNMIRQGAPVVTPAIGGGGQPVSRTVTAGATNVTFTVTATGFPPFRQCG
jgi:DNA-binding beta-propeller fold protein YncE